MKVKFSPLVASMSGTAADAVMASWKGIQYVRKHVIPHNPKTAAQMLVRDSLAACVTLWRSLNAVSKTWLDTYAVDYRLSGFNVFIQKCRALEQAGELLTPMPANPHVPAPADLAFVEGVGASGDIDISWTDNAPLAHTRIYFLYRLASANVFDKTDYQDSDAEAHTSKDLTPGASYDCYAFYADPITGEMGTTDGDLAITAKA